MKRFRNILYLFEEEPREDAFFARALDLARRNGAALTIAHVVEAPPKASDAGQGAVQERLFRDLSGEIEARLAELAAAHRSHHPRIAHKLLVGRPHVAVVREVVRAGHDLVMKKASPHEGLSAYLFGTLDTRLVELCPTPVWIDRPIPHSRYGRILAAVQLLEQEEPELEITILELACSLAELERAELHVLNAWQVYGERRMRERVFGAGGREDVERLVNHTLRRHEQALDALLQPFRDRPVTIRPHLVKGAPEVVIPREAERLGIDLIVLGSHVRSHLMGLLLGSVAEAVMRQARCALLVVKPPGFTTPLALDEEAG